MNSRIWFVVAGVTTVVGTWAGCVVTTDGGSGLTEGTGHTSTGTHTGTHTGAGGHTSSTTGTTTTTTATGGSATTNPYECTVPTTPPSAGSCVTTVAANDAGTGVECKPVTNAGCKTGQACDISADMMGSVIGFICYDPPNDAKICETCDGDKGPFCGGGLSCFSEDQNTSVCAKFCCSDADCGAGKCVPDGRDQRDPLRARRAEPRHLRDTVSRASG